MKQLLLKVFILTFAAHCHAQSVDDLSYSKAKLYLNDHTIITVNKFKIKDSEASFYNPASKASQKLALDNVNLILIRKGSHLWDGAAYGALIGALTAVLVDVDEDPLGRPNKVSVGEYIGLTAGTAALGALIGSFFPRWKQIYANGRFLGLNLPLNLSLDTPYTKSLDMQYTNIVFKITVPL